MTERETETAAPGALDDSVLAHLAGYLVARAATPLRRGFFERIGEPFGLRPVEFTVLALVSSNRDVTLKRLTQALSVTAPNITVVLDRLEARGLLKRVRSPHDRRSMLLHLLPAGEQLVAEALEVSREMELPTLSMLSPAERRMLLELLARVVRASRSEV